MKPKYNKAQPQQLDDVKINDTTLSGMIRRRAANAKAHWQKEYDLDNIRKLNTKLYDSSYIKEQLIDERYEDIFSDNRLFTSVRTIVSFITSRITQPEVTPSDDDPLELRFSQDFEKILVMQAEKVKGRQKVKLAVQDLLTGKRIGILKWGYNPTKDCLELEHLDPTTVLVDNTVKQFEEPNFVQITQERTVNQLIKQFPDKKDDLFLKLQIQKGQPSQLEVQKKVTETYIVDDNSDIGEIMVVWMYEDLVLGKIKDPTWMKTRKNVLEYPVMPFVFINFLNDGSGLIDHTSFIEQAQYSQKNYDKMGQRIVEDAQYGGIGVPVFGQGAIDQGEAAKVKFSPVQRIILDTPDVSKAFTTWQSGQLPTFIPEEKYDSRNNVDNTFGTPNIFRGEQSKNQTLGQDVIVRDQAEGRQAELIDSIDVAMTRFYELEAQFIYRYYDKDKFFNYLGDDGNFDRLVISQEKIAKNLGIAINIKGGTSLPPDRAQRRATVLKIADRMPTLTLYRELGIDDPEETYKLYLLEQSDPKSAIADVDKQLFDRDAEEDLAMVIGGETPEERDDLSDEYLMYLNEYLLTDKYTKLTHDEQARVSEFIDQITQKANRKLNKLGMQNDVNAPPPPIEGMSPEQAAAGAPPPQGAPAEAAPPPPMPPPQSPDTALQPPMV